MKLAVQFGAGNIGRGFIGKLLSEAGYTVYFADINKEVIEELQKKKEYTVEVVGDKYQEVAVKNVDGVLSTSDDVLKLISKAEIITTAVGPNVLKIIAKTLAKGISIRCISNNKTHLNIIACENMIKGSTFLKEEVYKYLGDDVKAYADRYIGFPDSAVDRIVPPMEESDDILRVRVEEFHEWIVDKTLFKGGIPEIKGMHTTDKLMAFVERKLFTLNTGHAITAYLGVLKGYDTVKESIEDEEIQNHVISAMKESGEVLIKRYGFDKDQHYQYIEKILKRFKNPYLKDEVKRVGREPLRKLGFNDRLIKPLRGTLEYGLENDNLVYGIAAALLYKNEEDTQSIEMQHKISAEGIETAVKDMTCLEDSSPIFKIVKTYQNIS